MAYQHRLLLTFLYTIALSVFTMTPSVAATKRARLIREQKIVMVDGLPETWQLRWTSKPTPFCSAHDVSMAITCPCSGVAYGEEGTLELMRIKSDKHIEKLTLGSLFADSDFLPLRPGHAALKKWDINYSGTPNDLRSDDVDIYREVKKRKVADVMQFADYDHDGRATEFLLQVDTLPCGKHQSALIGISKEYPHLHAFTSVDEPEKPVVVADWVWRAMPSSNGHVEVVDWECGDHGSEVETKALLSAKGGRFELKRTESRCEDIAK